MSEVAVGVRQWGPVTRLRRTPTTRRSILAAAVLVVLGASACGGGDSDLSEVAQRGKDTANANGCASCHGSNGQGGVGPAWTDLAGSEVELAVPDDEGGGTRTVVADEEYLLRSILDPAAEEVAGYTLKMPDNALSEAQARDIVAYIQELTSSDS
jgi:cytochrome c oxidase subunit 2